MELCLELSGIGEVSWINVLSGEVGIIAREILMSGLFLLITELLLGRPVNNACGGYFSCVKIYNCCCI